MKRAEVVVLTGRREREREASVRIESLRAEGAILGRDGVRDVVSVNPGHRRSRRHRERRRREGEVIDANLRGPPDRSGSFWRLSQRLGGEREAPSGSEHQECSKG